MWCIIFPIFLDLSFFFFSKVITIPLKKFTLWDSTIKSITCVTSEFTYKICPVLPRTGPNSFVFAYIFTKKHSGRRSTLTQNGSRPPTANPGSAPVCSKHFLMIDQGRGIVAILLQKSHHYSSFIVNHWTVFLYTNDTLMVLARTVYSNYLQIVLNSVYCIE